MNIVFLECGTTLNSQAHTGIQRVVRNILAHRDQGNALGLECIPVCFNGHAIMRHHAPRIAKRGQRLRRAWAGRIDRWVPRIKVFIGHFIPKSWLRRLIAQIRRFHHRATVSPDSTDDILAWVERGGARGTAGAPPVLLLLDSSWYMDLWPLVDRFRAAGGHVCAVLYDLIPFSHPQTVHEGTRLAHTRWWAQAPLRLDSVMCISATVREEFLAWQETQPLARHLAPAQVGYFHLGSELPAMRGQEAAADVPDGQYFLTVGTLEPRKNQAAILDAFERLWAEGVEVKLVVVGVFGWKSEALVERIRIHPELGRRLFHRDRASDQELAALYDHARAVIAASFAEGFGLPVVEAFQRGACVLCSDIPVFHEIAGEHAWYFNPASAASLADAVRHLLADAAPAQKRGRCWIGWKESARQLFERLNAIVRRPDAGPPGVG